MNPIKRAVHIDFHTMPGITDFGRNYSAEQFAQTLKNAHVEWVNLFAQCNLGFAYYPTKIGIPYPHMTGDRFGETLDACHKAGIRVVAYINIGLNHEHARLHPDWCRLNKHGQILEDDRIYNNFFRTMCYHSGYRDYLLDTIREICSYEIDGLFCDCMNLKPCYCTKCTDDMLARGIDLDNDDAVLSFAFDAMESLAHAIRDLVPPDKHLYLNGFPMDRAAGIDSHMEVECLPSAEWGYDYFPAQVAYARSINPQVVYMTGRFQTEWGDFGGFKTKASIENDFYDALSNCAELSLGDHQHPAENLEPGIYDTVEEIYRDLMRYEPWTQGTHFLSEIGILTNRSNHRQLALPDSIKGAARMLGELKYQFDVVNETMELGRFRVLILPDDLSMTPLVSQKLMAAIQGGAKVLSTGTAGLNPEKNGFALPQWSFLDYCGPDGCNAPYYHVEFPCGEEIDMRWSMYLPAILMKTEPQNQLASYIKPYFNKHWDGKHGYFYTPPERETHHAAAGMSGPVCHICFRIFTAYYQYAPRFHKSLVSHILKQFLPAPLVKTEKLPSTARVTTTGKEGCTLVHVKVTRPEPRGKFHIVEEHDVLPAGSQISVKGQDEGIFLLPDKMEIPSSYADGYTTFSLPQVTGYAMFLAEKK